MVLRDLSEYLTLAFVGAFDINRSMVDSTIPDVRSSQRVTYIALTKKVMPMLLDTFIRLKDNVDVYSDETIETVLSVSYQSNLIIH